MRSYDDQDDRKMKKRRKKRSKVHPGYGNLQEDSGLSNEGFEMGEKKKTTLKREVLKAANVFSAAQAVQEAVSKWRNYNTSRRHVQENKTVYAVKKKPELEGLASDLDDDVEDDQIDAALGFPGNLGDTSRKKASASNRAFISYFAKLGKVDGSDDFVDLDFLENLIDNGANVSSTDRYGQSVLHEVARAWHVDVAKFLLGKGLDPNQKDVYGRTALHVAAAVNYPEMVEFLVQHGADIEAKTREELQTPVHFAARNDAVMSLKMLIKHNADFKKQRDYKGRTPLHLAAELDRSETARYLVEQGAEAGVQDYSGQACITHMITKMPPVAKEALNQFHPTDRANRKQYYYLNNIEPVLPEAFKKISGEAADSLASTPMEVAVQYKQYEVLQHPVFLKLINIKWKQFARRGAWFSLFLNFIFIVTWTALAVVPAWEVRHKYTFPQDWWRIIVSSIAVLLTFYQIIVELKEFFSDKQKFHAWQKWRTEEIKKDLTFCHPRWPEEREFLLREIEQIQEQKSVYFSDFWNLFDWTLYLLLLVCITTHIVDVFAHSTELARWHIRIFALTIIIMWLRLMKNARAFRAIGPFIVILSHMFYDILRFIYLYLEFYIPFACAFWMLFGDRGVTGFTTVPLLLYSMFRLTLVDEYDYDGLHAEDEVFADLLLAGFFFVSAILCINLFIALLSDTFQRVYDNAVSNAIMQQAQTILGLEASMSRKKREKFKAMIHSKCAPLPEYYDDDMTSADGEDLQKITFQIMEEVEEMHEMMKMMYKPGDESTSSDHPRPVVYPASTDSGLSDSHRSSGAMVSQVQEEVKTLRDEISHLRLRQDEMFDRMRHDNSSMKHFLQHLIDIQSQGGLQPRGGGESGPVVRGPSRLEPLSVGDHGRGDRMRGSPRSSPLTKEVRDDSPFGARDRDVEKGLPESYRTSSRQRREQEMERQDQSDTPSNDVSPGSDDGPDGDMHAHMAGGDAWQPPQDVRIKSTVRGSSGTSHA
ncbi:PREDICTED: transient receptor potential cation channel subfamily A member 1-like isoform X4 [Branchiostoma belcheri]|uniref:Transient receptor potential cation channel subfamily A member 1-like isoform X4 n=1 Tax=Branchiostoma belcheri TaxID=7741 RepID=A0A6P4Z6S1_BRABE|nr:PREDICTED: transient receptor potential cation channel subfamily A member 1-like isoform X4 [Branchiostoma belcheri]